jgi:hypothetical protein
MLTLRGRMARPSSSMARRRRLTPRSPPLRSSGNDRTASRSPAPSKANSPSYAGKGVVRCSRCAIAGARLHPRFVTDPVHGHKLNRGNARAECMAVQFKLVLILSVEIF